MNLGPSVNSSAGELGSAISANGSTLYFSSRRPGGLGGGDIYQASIEPIERVVDFNSDGRIDFKDFSLLALYWLQDEPSVDIAPPLGDHMVDCKDIVVFAEKWLEDLRLVAHWKLDEEAGGIANDSAGENDGTVYGDPSWRPTAGFTSALKTLLVQQASSPA